MITRVVDQQGNVLHDCGREGCEVSWDGYATRPHVVDVPDAANPNGPAVKRRVAAGDELPGRADPDPALYDVAGGRARLKR